MTKRGQARTFDEDQLRDLLNEVTAAQAQKKNAQPPEVMRVAFMLSFYAGLRVQEIAGLEWNVHIFNAAGEFRGAPAPVFDDKGKVMTDRNGKTVMAEIDILFISHDIGKYGKARNIPLHKDLKEALVALHALGLSDTVVIPSAKSGAGVDLKHRAHALKMRINRLYKQIGLDSASSHSGRRSFGTRAARRAEAFDNSLLDVRDLMGHSSINTTQKYVDPSARQGDLVEALW
jgi:integrase/recombinase XerD